VFSWKLRSSQSKEIVEVIKNDEITTISIPRRGVITKKVIQAYRTGQCYALAHAISEQTGLPMVWIFCASDGQMPPEWAAEWDGRTVAQWRRYYESEFEPQKGWAFGFCHAVVRMPDDKLLDIGWSPTSQEWKNSYDNPDEIALLEATVQDIYALVASGTVAQPNMELANEFAPLALKRAGYGHLVS
jgi:hypothetical protein